jgi:Na+-driven multidrug efflux pump
MIGSFVPISALIFCLAVATTQAWLTYHRHDRASYVWIGMSLLGLVAATLGAIAAWYLSIYIFRLDVLQNAQHGAIVVVAIIVIFGIMMILSQWFVLQGKVRAPMLQAALNIIFGAMTWLFLVSRFINYENVALGLPIFAFLSVVLGMGLGGLIHKVLS